MCTPASIVTPGNLRGAPCALRIGPPPPSARKLSRRTGDKQRARHGPRRFATGSSKSALSASAEAKSFRQEVFENLSAVLAHPSDLEKVPAMLADAQEKQAATGGALSELIAMHCSHLRLGLEEMVTAISDMDTVRKRLDIIRELCKRSDVLTPSESAHAATLSTVQSNIVRTITGVDNIHRFPARAQEAAMLLKEVDHDPAALLDVFHDLSALLATQSVAHKLIETMKTHASASQSEEMVKVESYFGQVQRVSLTFTEKLLSYFDDVQHVARASPGHLVMAVRVTLLQAAVWERVSGSGSSSNGQSQGQGGLVNGGNPWGIVYKEHAVARMQRSAALQMQPVLLEADRVFNKWMQVHGRTAASFFHNHSITQTNSHKPGTSMSGVSTDGASDAEAEAGQGIRSKRAPAVKVPTAIVAKLIGGVTRAPIQLTSMAAPVETAPEAEEWLSAVQVDEEAVQEMQAALAHADEVVATLVDFYDNVLPCFPPQLNPVAIRAKAFSEASATMLDALGQAAASFDNAGLLALLGWMDGCRSVLINLGLPDDVIHISTVPCVKTPRGEPVLMHGLDVARLVYIDRIRKQLATAFKNLAEIDLLKRMPDLRPFFDMLGRSLAPSIYGHDWIKKEPEPDGEGRLWTPGVIEMFRFLTQQVELAASVRDSEVVRNVASVALQVMQSYQGLVLSAMVEKRLDFNQLVAVVNNNLIAYDQARDLASVIDSAIRANNDRGADDGDDSMLEGAAETSRRGSRERGGRRSTDSDGAMMMDTEIHSQMEDANRGFLNVSKVALEKAVECIFQDKGTTDVLKALYRGDEWRGGVITHSFLLTIADYLSDLKEWLDPPFYKRAVHMCLKDTVQAFRSAFLTQMPANRLGEADMERFDTDISDLREFYAKYIPPDKVDSSLGSLEAVQRLVQCESVDEFEETFGFMLIDESCKVTPKDVALVCAKRPDIAPQDAAAIEASCERQYQQWLATQKGRKVNSPRGEGEGEVNMLANLYNRVARAVGIAEE